MAAARIAAINWARLEKAGQGFDSGGGTGEPGPIGCDDISDPLPAYPCVSTCLHTPGDLRHISVILARGFAHSQ